MTRDLHGLDICIGAARVRPRADAPFVIGAFDVQKWQSQMNVLKQVPVGAAQVLLTHGQAAIKFAQGLAAAMNKARAGIPFIEDVPGETRRAEVAGKLSWHKDTLARVAPSAGTVYWEYTMGDKEAFKRAGDKLAATYVSGDDLKKWVLEAFKEANAIEEGIARLGDDWNTMWSEIAAAVAALSHEVAKKVGNVAENLAWYLKWVTWVAVAAGVVGVGLIAWGTAAGIKHRISGSSTK